MKRHILAEIYHPEEGRRIIPVPLSINFERDRTTKKICLQPKVKRYGLVFDKRAVEKGTGKTYPFGYVRLANSMKCKHKIDLNEGVNLRTL